MVWNPFDRRSADQRAIDDSVVDLERPNWSETTSAQSARFVRLILATSRTVAGNVDAQRIAEKGRLDRVRKRVERNGPARTLDVVEVARIKALTKTVRGRISLAAVTLAGTIEDLDAWTAPEFASRLVRIDLAEEVSAVGRSAHTLEQAFTRLGDEPTGHLAKDDEVMAVYRARTDALAERQRVLIARLSALRSYYDALASMQRELEKMRWLRRHSEPDSAESVALERDELGSMTLSAATDMFDQAADRFGDQMREAAELLRR